MNPGGDELALGALWLGVAASLLGAVAPCMCSFPWVIAFPMACIGLYRAFQAQKSTLTPTGQTVATIAVVANLVSTIFGAMFVLLFLFYALYFCAIFFFGMMGALGSSF